MRSNASARQSYRLPAKKPNPGPWDAPTAAFLSDVRRFSFMRTGGSDAVFYEQMKAQARSTFPHLPGHQWDRLIDEVARICGV